MFGCASFCVLSSFAIILMSKRELFAFLCLSSWYPVIVIVLWLFLVIPLAVLQCALVVFHDHTHMFFANGQKVSEYDQDIPHSHSADQPTAP